LQNGVRYFLAAAGRNQIGESAKSVAVEATPVATPTMIEAVGGVNRLYVAWNATAGAAGYRVRYFPQQTGVVETQDVGQEFNTAVEQYHGAPLTAGSWCSNSPYVPKAASPYSGSVYDRLVGRRSRSNHGGATSTLAIRRTVRSL
jgi:hypothetical protein